MSVLQTIDGDTVLTPEQQAEVCLVGGSSHPELASAIAASMGIELGRVSLTQFPNGEQGVQFLESVRERRVFIVQTGGSLPRSELHPQGFSIDNGIWQSFLLADAAERASAREVTIVAPCLPYARQDRKTKGREPISSAVALRLMRASGVHRIVTVDLHAQQTQSVFNGPFDHLTATELLAQSVLDAGFSGRLMVVAPDATGLKAADKFNDVLKLDGADFVRKRRSKTGDTIHGEAPDGVEGAICIAPDDMIDTGGTVAGAARAMKKKGAKAVIAVATHPILSGPAIDRLRGPLIDLLVVTDTLPLDRAKKALGEKLVVVPVASLIGKALMEIAAGGSVSQLFNGSTAMR